MLGALTRYHAVGTTSLQRGFCFAHPIHGDGGTITGVVAVKIDLARLETEWSGDQDVVGFTDKMAPFSCQTAALALEERAKQTLESTVERRTRALSVTNARHLS